MKTSDIFNVLVAIVLAVLRVIGIKSQLFQAVVHLYVGGLFGSWLFGRRKFYLWLFIALTVVETIMFLITFFNK